MGEHRESQYATLGDIQGLMAGVNEQISSLTTTISKFHSADPVFEHGNLHSSPTRAGEHSRNSRNIRFRAPITARGVGMPLASVSEAGRLPANSFPPGLVIPTHNELLKPDRWLAYANDWTRPDPERGLLIPLKDWPKEWYTGRKRVQFAPLRRLRRVIAEEFEV